MAIKIKFWQIEISFLLMSASCQYYAPTISTTECKYETSSTTLICGKPHWFVQLAKTSTTIASITQASSKWYYASFQNILKVSHCRGSWYIVSPLLLYMQHQSTMITSCFRKFSVVNILLKEAIQAIINYFGRCLVMPNSLKRKLTILWLCERLLKIVKREFTFVYWYPPCVIYLIILDDSASKNIVG